jgi:hypothetical protein
VNPAALFAAHKGAVLGVAAAGVAGLALMKRKSSGSAPAAAAAGAGATLPASVAADGFMGPDSSAYDVYNALQPELDALRQTVGTGVGSVPAPASASPIVASMPRLPLGAPPTFWRPGTGAKVIRPAVPLPAGVVAGQRPKYMP